MFRKSLVLLTVLCLILTGCQSKEEPSKEISGKAEKIENYEESSEESLETQEDSEEAEVLGSEEEVTEEVQEPVSEEPIAEETQEVSKEDTGIDPQFKAMMDAYEEFFNDYCDFMENYQNSDDALSMLADYTKFLTKYAEAMEAIDSVNQDELNNEELAYYIEVTARIQKRLLNAAV